MRTELIPFSREFKAEEVYRDFSSIERIYVYPVFRGSIVQMVKDWSLETSSAGLLRRVNSLVSSLSFEFGIATPSVGKSRRKKALGYYLRKNHKVFLSDKLFKRALDSTDEMANLIYTVCHEFAHALSGVEFSISELSHDGEYFYCLMRVMRHVSGNDLNKIFTARKHIYQFNKRMSLDEYSISLGTFTRIKKGHITELLDDSYNELIDKLRRKTGSEIDVPYVTIKKDGEPDYVSHFEFYKQPFQYLGVTRKKKDGQIYRYANVIIKKRSNKFVATIIKKSKITEHKKICYLKHLEDKFNRFQLEKSKRKY